jgi:hypothetical protein
MRKTVSFLGVAVIVSFVVFQSCSKGGSSGGTTPPNNQVLTVSLSKSTVRADNFDKVVVTVRDENSNDITGTSTIKVNGTAYAGNELYLSTPGTYTVSAANGSKTAPNVTLTAQDPGPSPFTQKVLVEDYTGTWCGYCPRVGVQLTSYIVSHPNCIVVGVHGPSGSGDPFSYLYVASLTNYFNVTGWPTGIVNRNYAWNEQNTVLDQEAVKRAPLGLSFETSIAGNIISVKTKVKFDVTTQLGMKLVVALVEDGLIYPQTNYYAPTYGGNPITSYTHNHVLRAAATDVFGDVIPVAQQTIGTTWESNLSFNASGYNMNNCKIVAFVLYDFNTLSRKGVLNVQEVTAGQNKVFD